MRGNQGDCMDVKKKSFLTVQHQAIVNKEVADILLPWPSPIYAAVDSAIKVTVLAIKHYTGITLSVAIQKRNKLT